MSGRGLKHPRSTQDAAAAALALARELRDAPPPAPAPGSVTADKLAPGAVNLASIGARVDALIGTGTFDARVSNGFIPDGSSSLLATRVSGVVMASPVTAAVTHARISSEGGGTSGDTIHLAVYRLTASGLEFAARGMFTVGPTGAQDVPLDTPADLEAGALYFVGAVPGITDTDQVVLRHYNPDTLPSFRENGFGAAYPGLRIDITAAAVPALPASVPWASVGNEFTRLPWAGLRFPS